MIARAFALMLALIIVHYAQAQELPVRLESDGIDLMQGLCEFHGLQPIAMPYIEEVGYDQVIFIILGDVDGHTQLSATVRQGLRRGSAVLIATETKTDLSDFFPDRTNVSVTGEKYLALSKTDSILGQPYAQPSDPTGFDTILKQLDPTWDTSSASAEYELFRGYSKVATNRPSGLVRKGRTQYLPSVVAEFPEGTFRFGDLNKTIPNTIKLGMAGSGPDADSYRVVVLADRSIFTNQMLALETVVTQSGDPTAKVDNLAFANNLVQWLMGPTQRRYCVFIDQGQQLSTFTKTFTTAEMPDILPPIPSPLDPRIQQRMTDMINSGVQKLEDRDVPNQLIQGSNGSDSRYKRWLLGAATLICVVLTIYLLRRLRSARFEPNMANRPKPNLPKLKDPHPPALKQTHQDVIRHGDFAPYIREYLQLLFTRQGLPPSPDPLQQSKPPKVYVGSQRTKPIRKAIANLWGIAYASSAEPITYMRWKELQPEIELLTRTAERDEWRFNEHGETR